VTRTLDNLRDRVEMAGFSPGTLEYEIELRRERVQQCQKMRGMYTCSDCSYSTECELRIAHHRDRIGKKV